MPDDRTPPRGREAARLGAARQQTILSLLSGGDFVAVGDLAGQLGVSQETIRRDIRLLEEAGRLRRVHGGAAPPGPIDLSARRPVTERLEVERAAKTLAAQAALPLFETGMDIFLGGSSTMLLLAEELAQHGPALSATTNMIDIATVLAAAGRFRVTLLGGVLKPATHTLVGPDVLAALERRVFDLSVCGASAVHPRHGILGPSEWHAAIGAAVAGRSHRFAIVADATKFGRSDAHVVQPLGGIAAFASDAPPGPELAAALRDAGTAVLLPGARLGPAAASSGARRAAGGRTSPSHHTLLPGN